MLLQEFPKVWRILEQVFLIPWRRYKDVVERLRLKTELKQLEEEFFKVKATVDSNMEVDNEAAVEPKILQGLIDAKVSKATKKLTSEVQQLKKIIQASKDTRPLAGAGKNKNAAGRKADAKSNASDADSKKNGKQNQNSTTSSKKKNSRKKRRSPRLKTPSKNQ